MNNVWICFDGIDATGKTTLADVTENSLRNSGLKVARIQEWSDTTFGDYIRERFLTQRFFTIGRDSDPCVVSSASALAADLCARAEAAIRARAEGCQVVVAEHHWISYIAYYVPILEEALGSASDAQQWLSAMVRNALVPLRMPDLCFALTTDQPTLLRRTVARGDPELVQNEVDVLLKAQAKIVELASAEGFPVVHTVGRQPEDTLKEILQILQARKLLPPGLPASAAQSQERN